MKTRCSFCGGEFEEHEIMISPYSGGVLCGVCYVIDMNENSRD